MTDTQETPQPAEMTVSGPRPSIWRNLSLVWLVPIGALVISLAIAWQSWSDRGVLIEIVFPDAAGVEAGETAIRFRDVVVGQVEDVGFTEDLSQVLVTARVEREVAPFVDDSATFWIVRPEVSARGITGLGTVLSGVYIAGSWDDTVGATTTSFEGTASPPLVVPGRNGTRLTLRATNGSGLGAGAPVLYRGVEVGQIERPRLTAGGEAVLVDAFIEAPHDALVSTATRFWDTSGFSVAIGTQGVSLEVDSLSALLAGGVAFDNVFEGGSAIAPDVTFEIFPDQASARRARISQTNADGVRLSVAFEDSTAGLRSGAAVEYGGLRVGEVTSIVASVQEEGVTAPELQLVASFSVDPVLLGLSSEASDADTLDFLEAAIAGGLRAQLATAGFLSDQLIVELANVPDAPPATLDRDAQPAPRIPSVSVELPDFAATAEGVLQRINELPIEAVMEQAIRTLASLEGLAANPDLRAAPGAAVSLLEAARDVVADPDTRALPGELRGMSADLRAILAELRERQAIENMASALATAAAAADNLEAASAEAPALMADLRALAAQANALETDELVRAVRAFVENADAVIGAPEAREVLPALSETLSELRQALADVRGGQLIENANAAMQSASDAAQSVAQATEGLPDLATRLERLVAESEALVAAYGARSDVNTQTLAALREITAAARSVSQLAREIERSPNSLIFGR